MYINIIHRLVSSYEDRALGLTENGEILGAVKNKTFPEYVDHVVKECKYRACNEHWEPQYMHCNYCDIRYDFIGRLPGKGQLNSGVHPGSGKCTRKWSQPKKRDGNRERNKSRQEKRRLRIKQH